MDIRVSRPALAEGKIDGHRFRLFDIFAFAKVSGFLLMASIFLRNKGA